MGRVTLKVKHIAKGRNIHSAMALKRATGLDYHTCHALYSGSQQRMDLKTLARLCSGLGCSVSDLLAFTPTKTRISRRREGSK
jgi:DNA-binding Xre family transcriptional regulator